MKKVTLLSIIWKVVGWELLIIIYQLLEGVGPVFSLLFHFLL